MGATMGTAPLKDDYQQLEAQVAAKMVARAPRPPRPPKKMTGMPHVKRVAQRVRTQMKGAM